MIVGLVATATSILILGLVATATSAPTRGMVATATQLSAIPTHKAVEKHHGHTLFEQSFHTPRPPSCCTTRQAELASSQGRASEEARRGRVAARPVLEGERHTAHSEQPARPPCFAGHGTARITSSYGSSRFWHS